MGAATPALADATNANAAQAQADGSNGKAADSNASEKAGANENAANNPHAAEPEAPAADDSAASEDTAAPSQTTTSSAKSTSATPGPKGAGCNQTPYGSGGNGANTGGVYDDTCQPAASGNGNGDGVAKGKPCAGCVGKADEKNPPGQQPGPQDKNKGYECDGNKGIARTNPAHTGCVGGNNECVPTAEDDCVPDCVPTAEDDCVPDCVPTAEDDCEPDCVPTIEDPCEPPCVPTDEDPCTTPGCVESATVTCTEVEGEVIEKGGAKVLGAVFNRGALARTGGSVLDLTLVGSVLVAAGFVLARMSRREGAIEG